MQIPKADVAIIGGSSTLNLNFPEELNLPGVQVFDEGLVFQTPYGKSPQFKLFGVSGDEGDNRVLCCQMHGWRQGISRGQASQQLFWVLREAGVNAILGEGGVGSVNHLLEPRDLLIADDYVDFSMRKDIGLEGRHLLVMREALCPSLRMELIKEAQESGEYRLFTRGVYAVTDGRHFESPAEVRFLRMAGADIVGQSLCPEVYLAREIGACYAGLYLVVNYGEGVIEPWQHRQLAEIYYSEGYSIGRILLQTVRRLGKDKDCQCGELRKETLLRPIY